MVSKRKDTIMKNTQTFYAYPYGHGKEKREIFGGKFKYGGFIFESEDGKYFPVHYFKTKNPEQHGYRRFLLDDKGRKIYEVR